MSKKKKSSSLLDNIGIGSMRQSEGEEMRKSLEDLGATFLQTKSLALQCLLVSLSENCLTACSERQYGIMEDMETLQWGKTEFKFQFCNLLCDLGGRYEDGNKGEISMSALTVPPPSLFRSPNLDIKAYYLTHSDDQTFWKCDVES